MTRRQRDRFDAILEEEIDALPQGVRNLLDEVPVIALDRPSRRMILDLGMDPADPDSWLLCGLHTGRADTERSVEHSGELPSEIHLFREGIAALARQHLADAPAAANAADADNSAPHAAGADGDAAPAPDAGSATDEDLPESPFDRALRRQIRITLLHEIGHQFGLDEDDLARLGYE